MEGHRTAGATAAPRIRSTSPNQIPGDEIARWQGLGVAVLPGPRGQKGPRQKDWPSIPHAEAWRLSRVVAVSETNLCVRTGATEDGLHHLAAIDLDGKCLCGHDHAVHADGAGTCSPSVGLCICSSYEGTSPDAALEQLLSILPPDVAISKTNRGYHLLFWAQRPLPNGKIAHLSADLFGGATPAALQIPPSIHPSGRTYEWLRQPGRDLPVVDLEALGLVPDEGQSRDRARSASGRTPTPAPALVQREFAELMATLGVIPGQDQERARCPWHADDQPSLSVAWAAALFNCFGCGVQGSIRELRELVGTSAPPSYNPSTDPDGEIQRGLQVGGSGIRDERLRLADAVEHLGDRPRADRIRECREATWDAVDSDLVAFACPSGDSTPIRTQTNSCDDPQCPTCMPWRLAADCRHHFERPEVQAGNLTLVTLRATEPSIGLDDWQYLRRVRAKFREWQRARGLAGGLYALTVRREGADWRAELFVVVGESDRIKLTDGRAFHVERLDHGLTSDSIVRTWQQAYVTEATAWTTVPELDAYRALTRGRRRFQGFGQRFGTSEPAPAVAETEQESMDDQPLHRVSGGSGKAGERRLCCPRCGERLKRIGAFKPSLMKLVVAEDGVPEWRWREGGAHRG